MCWERGDDDGDGGEIDVQRMGAEQRELSNHLSTSQISHSSLSKPKKHTGSLHQKMCCFEIKFISCVCFEVRMELRDVWRSASLCALCIWHREVKSRSLAASNIIIITAYLHLFVNTIPQQRKPRHHSAKYPSSSTISTSRNPRYKRHRNLSEPSLRRQTQISGFTSSRFPCLSKVITHKKQRERRFRHPKSALRILESFTEKGNILCFYSRVVTSIV